MSFRSCSSEELEAGQMRQTAYANISSSWHLESSCLAAPRELKADKTFWQASKLHADTGVRDDIPRGRCNVLAKADERATLSVPLQH